MKYNRHSSFHHRTRRQHRYVFAVIVVGFILLAVGIFEGYKTINRIDYNPDDQTTSEASTTTIVAKDQTFQTPYFQFTAGRSWVADAGASGNGVYVYRSMRSKLLEHQLTVYVNSPPPKLEVTRVLPITIEKNAITIGAVSEHCGKVTGYNRQLTTTIVSGVTISCFGDDTKYSVLAGLVGGTPQMNLSRPDGSMATYTIYYSNVTAMPDAAQFSEIMQTFRTR